MTGFLVKKTFFDMWDNMIAIVLINIGFLLLAASMMYVLQMLFSFPVVFFPVFGVFLLVLHVYAGVVAWTMGQYADYRSVSLREFFSFFRLTFVSSLLLGIIHIALFVVLSFVFPFYYQMGGIFGIGAMALLFWMTIIWILSSQFYFGVRKRLDENPKKILKKCFILFFDNTLFTVGAGAGSLIILLLMSFPPFLMLPGISILFLFHQNAVKLRLYKYDYLEKNPDTNRRKIPWRELLVEDREKVGPRTLKGMFFPWKE